MPQAWGLSDAGFKPKELNIIKEELETALKNEVDPYLHFGPGSVASVLVGIIANQSRQVWEALAGLYHSLRPDAASGSALDALCSLTGTYRRRASFSRVTAKLTLDAHTALPAGSRIKTIGGDFFRTTADVNNDAANKNEIEVDFIAEEVGPKLAHDGSAAEIMTPTAGWSSAVIIKTYFSGRYNETDDELRIRRVVELRATGSSTLDAMRSRLLQLNGVEAVHVKEGEHSFEVIIKGGNVREIAQTIWQCKPLGIKSSGDIKEEIEDSFKQSRIVKFSRPKLIHLTLHANLRVRQLLDEPVFKASLAEFARNHFELGAEIYPSRLFATILSSDNVLDVITLQIRERYSGRMAPSEIKDDEIASLSLNDIYLEQVVESPR
jgi:uncharacterized phage protein gp47/JayE